jgi:NTP pyrophosphatase (non-canonical NTP hydrolase)
MKEDEVSSTGKLATQCIADSRRWFPEVADDLAHHVLSLCGEAGELANMVKKLQRGSLDFHDAKVRFDIVMEVTDVYIYLLNIAGLLNVDLEKAYEVKRGKNESRFTRVPAAGE